MKKLLIPILIALFVISMSAFTAAYEIRKNTAEVETYNGVYFFYKSMPASSYDVLGSNKITFVSSNTPANLMEKLVRKTKDKYPLCEGVIISEDMGSCQAIKFK